MVKSHKGALGSLGGRESSTLVYRPRLDWKVLIMKKKWGARNYNNATCSRIAFKIFFNLVSVEEKAEAVCLLSAMMSTRVSMYSSQDNGWEGINWGIT